LPEQDGRRQRKADRIAEGEIAEQAKRCHESYHGLGPCQPREQKAD
jgi:hypothetical protein